MKFRNFGLLLLFCLIANLEFLYSQKNENGFVEGRIFNISNNEPVPFAKVVIWGATNGVISDIDGKFTLTNIKPGYISVSANSIGYEPYISEEFLITNAKKIFLEIPLTESKVELEGVVVKASPFRLKEESPVSLRRIGIEQIEKNPGGNRDISKVIQSYPGVASTPAYRNDVIVRGGGPGENKFYLDGVEIPNLNHFATQGASGGPVGIINVDFIREVNFYSGAFPANTGNAMSSVLDMRQIDGNKDKLKFKGAVGASDLALTLDGPFSKNTTFIASARRSYLQYLFTALELPFLPTYNDLQVKTRTRINDKNEITFIGLGAIDHSELNLKANKTPDQRYILSYLPVYDQWNYTTGLVFKHFRAKGYDTYVLSRNYLNNTSYKYLNNNESEGKTLDYKSYEIENKFRYEHNTTTRKDYKINYGFGIEYAKYFNNTSRKVYQNGILSDFTYNTFLDMFNYNLFGQVSRAYFNKRLSLSLGARFDGSTYSNEMINLLKQFSPRFSSSYSLSRSVSWNFNMGRYNQRPPYTAMGYKNASGELINKENKIKFINCDHIVTGFEYQPSGKSQFSMEGFYKKYSHYPFSVKDSVPLATKGADFTTYGDEELIPVSKGRAYGFEILGRLLDLSGYNVVVSYTFVRSEFKDLRTDYFGEYIPTSWDNRNLLNITVTRTFKSNWFIGFKWRYIGGAPYTPYDPEKSSVKSAWDAQGYPYYDYSKYNDLRLDAFHQLDLRVDKNYYFNKWSINFYIDIQNLYNYKASEPDKLVRKSFEDPTYNDVYTDENGIERYELETIVSSGAGTILPTVGIIVEF
jgi:hypothetical protein